MSGGRLMFALSDLYSNQKQRTARDRTRSACSISRNVTRLGLYSNYLETLPTKITNFIHILIPEFVKQLNLCKVYSVAHGSAPSYLNKGIFHGQ